MMTRFPSAPLRASLSSTDIDDRTETPRSRWQSLGAAVAPIVARLATTTDRAEYLDLLAAVIREKIPPGDGLAEIDDLARQALEDLTPTNIDALATGLARLLGDDYETVALLRGAALRLGGWPA